MGFDDPVDRTRRVLTDLAEQRLSPGVWAERLELIERLAKALDADDAAASGSLLGLLEMLSGDRVNRIVPPDAVPPPEPVRERLGLLIHAREQQGDQRGGEDGRGDEKGRGDGSRRR
ncbi:hypothetical protein KDL01_27760 [Actinospica durhamensis]|uniref:CATRA-Associated Small Protein domain-containing protein n=1 Tax=Actinospica durhamensis TaxID=1508375 RepID=A0A941IPZ8_9ACTN|nr:CATRA system-associated protein [Actinospica durhamensis]MBR7837105.1 hypothetical protein [Actinospica durhamensis]